MGLEFSREAPREYVDLEITRKDMPVAEGREGFILPRGVQTKKEGLKQDHPERQYLKI